MLPSRHLAFTPSSPSSSSSSRPSSYPPSIPLSAAMMECVSWITLTFAGVNPHPSARVLSVINSSSPAAADKLVALIDSLCNKVTFSADNSQDDNTKRDMGKKIYWTIIEQLVTQQHNKAASASASSPSPSPSPPPSPSTILSLCSPWLLCKSFHCSLVALCLEIIVFSYNHSSLSFPAIVNAFDLRFFEYVKVIDTVQQQLPSLPHPIRTHLEQVENAVVERRVWSTQPQEKTVTLMSNEESRKQVETHMNNMLTHRHTEETAAGTGSNSFSSSPSPDLFVLMMIYKKLLQLSAARLNFLSSDVCLALPPLIEQATWTLLCHVLLRHPSLLFDRDVDTLLLCSLYTICVKLAHLPIDFKHIINVYLTRWENKGDIVVRQIKAGTEQLQQREEPGEDKNNNPSQQQEDNNPSASINSSASDSRAPSSQHVNIIAFYNTEFISTIKVFALQSIKPALSNIATDSNTDVLLPLLIPTPVQVVAQQALHITLPSNINVFISPMKHVNKEPRNSQGLPPRQASPAASSPSAFANRVNTNTPTKRTLVAVVGYSPTKKLKEMNEMLRERKDQSNAEMQQSQPATGDDEGEAQPASNESAMDALRTVALMADSIRHDHENTETRQRSERM